MNWFYKYIANRHKNRCENGKPNSCYKLALMYIHGKGVKKDNDKHREYLERACKRGHGEACLYLGLSWSKEDPSKAIKFFEEASDCGNKLGEELGTDLTHPQ